MARIKIGDLAENKPPSEQELQRITGGGIVIQERNFVSDSSQANFQFNPKEFTISKTNTWER